MALQDDGQQCPHDTNIYTRYCLRHVPKSPLIVTALLSTGASLLWGFLHSSAEKQETVTSRQIVVDQVNITSELASPIKNVNIIFLFKKPMPLETFKGKNMLLSLSREDIGNECRIEVLSEIADVQVGQPDPHVAIVFYSKESINDKQTFESGSGYTAMSRGQLLSELALPVSIGPIRNSPLSLVRDLEGLYLQAFLPPEIAEAVDRVEVVANPNFGLKRRLQILSCRVAPFEWEKTEYDVPFRFWRRDAGKKVKTSSLRDAMATKWSINISKAAWETDNTPGLEGCRFPFKVVWQ